MHRLRNILVGTTAYRIFEDVNLERVPLHNDNIAGYQYAQFSTEYLKLASGKTISTNQYTYLKDTVDFVTYLTYYKNLAEVRVKQ